MKHDQVPSAGQQHDTHCDVTKCSECPGCSVISPDERGEGNIFHPAQLYAAEARQYFFYFSTHHERA